MASVQIASVYRRKTLSLKVFSWELPESTEWEILIPCNPTFYAKKECTFWEIRLINFVLSTHLKFNEETAWTFQNHLFSFLWSSSWLWHLKASQVLPRAYKSYLSVMKKHTCIEPFILTCLQKQGPELEVVEYMAFYKPFYTVNNLEYPTQQLSFH